MRLLDTHTGQFVEKDPENEETVYAILSHTWDGNGEQTYEELRDIQRRYAPPLQTHQDGPQGRLKSSASSSSRIKNLYRTHHSSCFSPLLSDSTLWNTRPPTALGCPIPSEMEPSMRPFVQMYGLTSPISASVVSHHSALSYERRPDPSLKSIWEDPELSPKIRNACWVARKNGYRYIWIDSCCIDKSSSSELSEAINSMYKWYGLAAVCYAYLADVPSGKNHHVEGSAFCKSRWFRRGWTLQELIAPVSVEFLSRNWAAISSKHALVDLIETITKIDYKALLHLQPLDAFSVAQRLSWAAERITTRVEDRAYSLLGIFDINMPTLYGEGDRAFRRLQELIMQRTPDQSLLAWGDLYLGPQLFQDLADLTYTLEVCHAQLQTIGKQRHLFANSPDHFKRCHGIRTARPEIGRSMSSHGNKISYTPTPYGISTKLWMVPLTQDLLLRAIPHSSNNLRLNLLESPEGSRWYLVILPCELEERPGHRLSRICYVTPSEESNVNFLYAGCISLWSQGAERLGLPHLLLLSPEIIEYYRPHTGLQRVHIPHPDHATLPQEVSSRLRHQPYTTVKLVLLRETRDTLHSRGYSANLYDPDPAYPTRHWLTLSKHEHTIALRLQHTLEDGGRKLCFNAEVMILGSCAQLGSGSPPDPNQVECHTVSWRDYVPWETELRHKSVGLSAAGAAGKLTVELGLDFSGGGYYFLRVDVLSDAPPASSAVTPAVDRADERERFREGSPSRAVASQNWEGWSRESRGGRWM